jgi:hypothetical protein
MKDTRPVHMGTFEQYRRHSNTEMEMLKKDTVSMQKSINGLYNRTAKTERLNKILIIIAAVAFVTSGLAIYLTTIL